MRPAAAAAAAASNVLFLAREVVLVEHDDRLHFQEKRRA